MIDLKPLKETRSNILHGKELSEQRYAVEGVQLSW